jgi:hypothetical protein
MNQRWHDALPGSAAEHGCEIDLHFTVANLRRLLVCAANSSTYSHEQIADWARLFWWHFMQVDDAESQRQWSDEMKRAANVAESVDVQWELFLANMYPFEQLQAIDFSQVRLPAAWFEKWLVELN